MQPLSYSALERIPVRRPVDRLAFFEGRVAGKRVLDLGALDETAFQLKHRDDSWLHARLCRSASDVLGVDNSHHVPEAGMRTADNGRIIRADIFDLPAVLDEYGVPDVIVAGELIEHLPNTDAFLRQLGSDARLRGVELLFSTPNACCLHNVAIGLLHRESMHVDHLQIYSYKTLRTLFRRTGIELVELLPAHARFQEMRDSSAGLKRVAVGAFQRAINLAEYVFPLLSGSWLGMARL